MFFFTNREFDSALRGFGKFGKCVNSRGPNELYAIEVNGAINNPTIKQVPDILKHTVANRLIKKYHLELPEATGDDALPENKKVKYFASLQVSCNVFQQARDEEKSVLFYVHGYNNDVEDIYKTAKEIERLYGVIVVVFTWPANGGGAVSGTLSYLADKRDARTSKDALNRTIDIFGHYHGLLTNAARCRIRSDVEARYPDNPTRQREVFSRKIESYCKVSVNMLCHSMGNYVLKHALNSELAEARKLVFDNISLVAADTNNELHEDWVDLLQVRSSVYIAINENDYALSWSRRKPGEQQKARLGHYLKRLESKHAIYVDMTKERAVGESHSYFDGKTVNKNAGVKRFFKGAFCGDSLASRLEYRAHNNTYRPK